tara:strand:+ start:1454 stop:2317 length:864 start_codon:yes stop_codon:yes gene_type:complete
MADNDREADLRSENIDTAVKAVVKIEEKWKALCAVDSSSAWTESYFRETNDDSTDGGTGSPIRGVPQYAPFPFFDVTETKVSSVIQKYAGESIISLEAQQNATVPMLQRKIYRLGRKIVYQVDVAIEAGVAADFGNTVAITAGNEWDSATIANRDPVKDILDAVQTLRVDGIDALTGNGYIVVNGTDYTNIISNTKVLNHPTYESGVMQNGQVGRLLGMTIVISEATTADTAYVLVARQGMVWKEAEALKVKTIVDEGKSTTIRAWERGVFQLQAPNEVCKITNTRA